MGCWEILASELVRRGFPLKALARPLREARLDEILRRHRSRMGVDTLSSKALPISAFRHLRGNGFLGILADQRVLDGGVDVSFLGQPTRMTDAPARLALATGAPIVPMGIRRLSAGRHLATVLPPIRPREGRINVTDLTQAVASSLEHLIRVAPDQWIWIHPRWEEEESENRNETVVSGEPIPEPEKEEVCVSR